MAMNFEEYLKENGATEEEIKTLAGSKAARSSYEKMTQRLESAERERAQAAEAAQKANEQVTAYDKWFQEKAIPERQQIENDLIAARAEAAKNAAIIKAAQERGLIEVGAAQGADVADATKRAAEAAAAAGLDPNKYFTREEILQIAQQEGEAIAMAQDIAAEHAVLFPNKPLSFRELRKEAMANRQSIEQFWMNRYGVQAAREARAKAAQEAEQAKWKAEGAKEKETELVSRYGNPETRPLVPSTSPFAKRPERGRDKQPWEAGDRSDQRVMEATKKVVSQLSN